MTVSELVNILAVMPPGVEVRVTCPLGCTHALAGLNLTSDAHGAVVYAEGSNDLDDVKGR